MAMTSSNQVASASEESTERKMVMGQYNQEKQTNGWRLTAHGLIKRLPFIAAWLLITATALVAADAAHKGAISRRSSAQQSSTPAEWKAVEQAMGKAGAMQPGEVYKFSFPRSD